MNPTTNLTNLEKEFVNEIEYNDTKIDYIRVTWF